MYAIAKMLALLVLLFFLPFTFLRLTCLAGIAIVVIWNWAKFGMSEGVKIRTISGYLPPLPPFPWLNAKLMGFIRRVLYFVGVGGPLFIIKEDPEEDDEAVQEWREIVCANHPEEWDPVVLASVLPFGYRFPAAQSQLYPPRGFHAALAGGLGVGYDTKEDRQAALDGCVRALRQSPTSRLFIFPSGTRRVDVFATGTIRMMREVAADDVPVKVRAIFLAYITDPAQRTPFHNTVYKIGLKIFKSCRTFRKLPVDYRKMAWLDQLPYRLLQSITNSFRLWMKLPVLTSVEWLALLRKKIPRLGVKIFKFFRRFRKVFGRPLCGVYVVKGKLRGPEEFPIDSDNPTDARLATEFLNSKVYGLRHLLPASVKHGRRRRRQVVA